MGSKNIITVEEGRTIAVSSPKDPEDAKRYTFDYAYGIDSVQSKVRLWKSEMMLLLFVTGLMPFPTWLRYLYP